MLVHQERIVLTANALIVIGADRHPAGVAGHVDHPVRVGLAQLEVDEVVHVDRLGLPGRAPFPAAVLVVADELFLLGVHADHRLPALLVRTDLGVEVGELGVPVRVPAALDLFGVCCQAEPVGAQQLADGLPGDPVPGRGQFRGQVAHRQRGPGQCRARIPPAGRLDQREQRRQQPQIGLLGSLASAADPSGPAHRGRPAVQLVHPVLDPGPGRSRGPRDRGDPAMAQRPRLTGQHQPGRPLVQMREHHLELRLQHRLHIRSNSHTALSTRSAQSKHLFTDAS